MEKREEGMRDRERERKRETLVLRAAAKVIQIEAAFSVAEG